jgi:hypothetical protein
MGALFADGEHPAPPRTRPTASIIQAIRDEWNANHPAGSS